VHTFIERIEIGEKILPKGQKIASPRTSYRQSIRIFYRFIGEMNGEAIREVNKAVNF
jgi:site-specific DNA recombinase